LNRWGRAAAVLLVCIALPPTAAAQPDPVSGVYDAVATGFGMDTARAAPHVTIDRTGDTTIEFAIRNAEDDPADTRDGAIADTLTVLRAVYGTSPADGVRTVTVLGTFPFQGTKSPAVRPTPVLRAVLSADHARNIDWQAVSPGDLPTVVDVWWLQGAFADVQAQPAPATQNDPGLNVAIAHLEEAVAALTSGDIRIGRSQFTQFFDAWDDVSDSIVQRDPVLYEAIDADVERAEVALLHSQPEDVDSAQAALTAIHTRLLDLSSQSH
jgi:hypothetical protein